ncbi:MAG TPA: EpsI family protein [Terriglobales bacterium]|nr:EpsI family protein [Terriglobales bacterium]
MKQRERFAVTAVLLAATAFFLQVRDGAETIPARPPLRNFPQTLGPWKSVDIPISPEVREVLGQGDFLLRDYQDGHNQVDLFLAYFPSQRSGDTIHSPKNCLPGAGWGPVSNDRVTISVPGHRPFPANRYLIAKGQERQLVLYWYWAHDRAVASEYSAKLYLVADSIRMRRSDGSLVRISTPLGQNQSPESAEQALRAFAAEVVPLLNTYVPR